MINHILPSFIFLLTKYVKPNTRVRRCASRTRLAQSRLAEKFLTTTTTTTNMSQKKKSILVLNPNSSKSVTDGLEDALAHCTPNDVKLHFRTGPSSAPPSINDAPTSVQSAWANFTSLTNDVASFDAILVCCFSDHPLVAMLRHVLPADKPVMHILEASVLAALSTSRGRPFGIITTGADMVRDIDAGVVAVLGASHSRKYAGCLATGLGVVEMRKSDKASQEHVRTTIRQTAARLAERDVGAVIVGCAGMAGFEGEIRHGLANVLSQDAAKGIAIIDGVKAGVNLLAGQLRAGYYEDDGRSTVQ